MAKIIGVKFKNTSKVYYFAPANDKDVFSEKDGVVVETAKGIEFGKVVFGIKEVEDEKIVHPLKPIIRKATPKDWKTVEENEKKIPDAMAFAEEKIKERKLDMKLIGCEYGFDGKKLVFFFSADGRIDFRELVKDLATKFHVRIELRQIGIRDETKILGGLGPCGRPCCCASCGCDFGKVSVKMAKTQGLHLNPSKISGLCGRLMCCLEFEDEYYSEVYKKMPKLGSTVTTPEGDGTVISNDMLKLNCVVKIQKSDGGEVYKTFPVKEIKFNRPNKKEEAELTKEEAEELKNFTD